MGARNRKLEDWNRNFRRIFAAKSYSSDNSTKAINIRKYAAHTSE